LLCGVSFAKSPAVSVDLVRAGIPRFLATRRGTQIDEFLKAATAGGDCQAGFLWEWKPQRRRGVESGENVEIPAWAGRDYAALLS
jgi:hypothetical protein